MADSLQQLIDTTANDSLRGRALNKLSFHYIFNDAAKALPLIDRGLQEARQHDLLFGESELLNTKAIYFDLAGNKDSAAHYFEQSLELSQRHGFTNVEVLTRNAMGLMFWKTGQFEEALSNFFSALEINETQFPDQRESQANYLSNIGLIYQELEQYNKAIAYHQQALFIREELQLLNGMAISYANLGVCEIKLSHYDRAENFYTLAIENAEAAGNMHMYFSLHDNLGNLYNLTERTTMAISAYRKSLERPASLVPNPKSKLSAYTNLASLHNKLAKPDTALVYANKGLDVLNAFPQLRNFADGLYFALAESNYMLGNISAGNKGMKEYKSILDSVFSDKNALALAEMEKKYESAQKDKSILEQQQIIQQKELAMQRMVLGALLLLVFILFAAGFFYFQFKRKEAAAKQATLELHLAEQKELARIQSERLRISRELHDNIGSYLTLMSASLEQLYLNDENVQLKIERLKDHLKMSLRELRSTVWLLKRQAVSVDEISIRLRDFFKPLHQNGTNIEICTEGNTDCLLSEIQTTHLFRVVQEAVNNAYKYAECRQIRVQIIIKINNEMCVLVSDDGKGFDQKQVKAGNGFLNMEARMKELNGSLKIISCPGYGTEVEGCFNLQC
ncbi:MAG: sensor histidine kinase [Prolixibacteraceae bacterium]|nr:sensor histidine kinase [Prolixibacteraceae bacterium]